MYTYMCLLLMHTYTSVTPVTMQHGMNTVGYDKKADYNKFSTRQLSIWVYTCCMPPSPDFAFILSLVFHALCANENTRRGIWRQIYTLYVFTTLETVYTSQPDLIYWLQ